MPEPNAASGRAIPCLDTGVVLVDLGRLAASLRSVRSAVPILRTFHHAQFDAAALADVKDGQTVTVCLPARDEAATVGHIVEAIGEQLVEIGLVDEILVVDDHSSDSTATVARASGARVVAAADVLPEFGNGHGVRHPAARAGRERTPDRRRHATLPPEIVAAGDRAIEDAQRLLVIAEIPQQVSELVARPLLAVLFPHLTSIVQPLGGEYAGRRELLEQLPFVEGYGVDIALLIDIAARFGTDVIAQADLGTRMHRNRPLDELSPQAMAIMQTALQRSGRPAPTRSTLVRPGLESIDVIASELPPIAAIPSTTQVARGA